jgi:hypothetical protein
MHTRGRKAYLSRMILLTLNPRAACYSRNNVCSLMDQKISIIFTCIERLRARVAVMIQILEP